MIVVGYQGIGKSTVAGRNHEFIDLESGNFWVDGKRADDWYRVYCQIAVDLSRQGYIVFTSSHKEVREQLAEYAGLDNIVVVYPATDLKDEWIKKLEDRYRESCLVKDYKAMMNAKNRYTGNIKEMKETPNVYHMELTHMEYDLEAAIIAHRNSINRKG